MSKKYLSLSLAIVLIVLTGCATSPNKELTYTNTIDKLIAGNNIFLSNAYNSGDVSKEKRMETAENGQFPYAVIITCSDSRVVPEHVFNAGIGELFVIRTAGNVIGEFELGSIEYGVEHLNADTIVVIGHTGCGAVSSTIQDNAHGNIKKITDEIKIGIGNEVDSSKAEIKNIEHSISKILSSDIIEGLIKEKELIVTGAIYDTATGSISFVSY